MDKKDITKIEQHIAQTDIYEYGDVSKPFNTDIVLDLQAKIAQGKKIYPNDFYVELQHTRIPTTLYLLTPPQKTLIDHMDYCPRPKFGQMLFKYIKNDDKTHHLWSVPDRVSYISILRDIPTHLRTDKELTIQALKYRDGVTNTLYKEIKEKEADARKRKSYATTA